MLIHKFIPSVIVLVSLSEDYAALYKYDAMLHICIMQQLATTLYRQESSELQMQTSGKQTWLQNLK